ncbi:ead/Ea22-like family protein [Pseudomonas putida]|uniref:ead/Ea22-like family protein n=1 Tax=Pseudomonas TaxID=286 RepID=UPI00069BFE26|nr:ead/Ea22-like family protein [Pseudomonas putida]
MTIDKEKLKALAQAATQGEWSHERFGVIQAGPVIQFASGAGRQQIAMATGADWMVQGEQIANAEFMAAANPSVVLALLAEIERLESAKGDPVGSFDKHMEYMQENIRLKAENEDYRSGQDRYEQIIDDLKAESEALRKALGKISVQVDGNIRCAVRDVVNGLPDVQDIYGYCDNIDEIIEAAMAKEVSHD